MQLLWITPLAGNISHIDDILSAAGIYLFVFLLHLIHAGAGRIVEFHGVGIQYVGSSCDSCGTDGSGVICIVVSVWGCCVGVSITMGAAASWDAALLSAQLSPVSIINTDPRLHIVGKYTEADTLPGIFHRIGFHEDTVCQQVIPVKYGSDTVQDMIPCIFDIIADFRLKREHSLHVEISGSGDPMCSRGSALTMPPEITGRRAAEPTKAP